MTSEARSKTALIAMTAIAAPAALGLETLLRALIFPPELEELRTVLEPVLTPIAWTLVAIAAVAGVAGAVLQRHLTARAVARAAVVGSPATIEVRERASVGAFLLAASVPQIPAVLVTLAFTFGAALAPVVAAVAVSTLAVCVQALRASRS